MILIKSSEKYKRVGKLEKKIPCDSVGIVEPKKFVIEEPILLDCGEKFGPIEVVYETYGKLNEDKTNAVLILHALTGDAHVAGYHTPEDKKPGWWEVMVGPGKAIDTNKFFVICSNVLGSCNGTTGPTSINPKTGKPYGLDFPIITIKDMVKVQKKLIDYLGIPKILSVIGGSMGGMQALQWAVSYSDMIYSCIPIATTSRLSAQSIAFNEVGRQAILSDKNFNNGEYYGKEPPAKGLAIARMIGHITYLSDEIMHKKFGRKLQFKENLSYDFLTEFSVESYLHYQGRRFVERFDANSYLYLTKAMDYFDLAHEKGSLEKAFENSYAKYLIISYSSDWLFPPYQSQEIVNALLKLNFPTTYVNIQSPHGHDSFLLKNEKQEKIVSAFLNATFEEVKKG